MHSRTKKWILVVGARPNFMKIAPLLRAINKFNQSRDSSLVTIDYLLIHTGQHYDFNMSDAFFRDLDLPNPDLYLGVGSGNHGEQTGKVLIAFEEVLLREKPDLVIVVGDVNSTLACALAAVKLHIPVAHVESGLRSFDRKMPEEINRLLTDAVSDFLFTPSPEGDENLLREGIPREKIFLVGDVMVDSLLYHLKQAKGTNILERLGLMITTADGRPQTADHGSAPIDGRPPTGNLGGSHLCGSNELTSNLQPRTAAVLPYALMTLHRPANVDSRESFEPIVRGILEVTKRVPVIFPIHPRTLKQVKVLDLESAFELHSSWDMKPEQYLENGALRKAIHCFAPMGYLDFLNVMAHAKVVLTDSGGIQEETTVLDVPCITLRDTTERPITLTQGTNVLAANDPEKILAEVEKVLSGNRRRSRFPSIWDGHSAERIVQILVSHFRLGAP